MKLYNKLPLLLGKKVLALSITLLLAGLIEWDFGNNFNKNKSLKLFWK